jgi:hypothetical protein
MIQGVNPAHKGLTPSRLKSASQQIKDTHAGHTYPAKQLKTLLAFSHYSSLLYHYFYYNRCAIKIFKTAKAV